MHKKEKTYYVIALVFSIIASLVLLISIIGIYILLFIVVVPLIAQAILNASIRINGVRITQKQFPEIYEIVYQQSLRMGLPALPDVYIMESSGVLNAFATRFFGRNMVVLYSDLFELMNRGGSKELTFVISHELAHLQRRHLTKQLFIIPAMWMPFLGDAYSRACEYTCDRMATHFTEDSEAAMNGLTVLAVGKSLYKQVDREDYLLQSSSERGLFVWLAEKLSTHPPLPKRIDAIQRYVDPHLTQRFRSSRMTYIIIGSVCVAILLMFITGIVLSASLFKVATSAFEDSTQNEELLDAALNGETLRVTELLQAGADPNTTDYDGWTVLMSAADQNNLEMAKALLDSGASIDLIEEEYENTALTVAITGGYVEMAKLLLDHQADPNLQDSYGWTPLMTAASHGDESAVMLLLEYGADPSTIDDSGWAASDYALESGYEELAEKLKPGMGEAA
ncbi:M48 family metallopeptidase [Paenibacillus sp. YIM B09110]|uniref:M48 family metallopeptidase n=1 Tax=Paenibacillus sp. YIM B09110 TaxID=3126102 RepID=UPI00301C315D